MSERVSNGELDDLHVQAERMRADPHTTCHRWKDETIMNVLLDLRDARRRIAELQLLGCHPATSSSSRASSGQPPDEPEAGS